jgi:hypothetical protein
MRNEQANTRKQFKSVSNPSRGLGASAGYGATSGRFKHLSVSDDSIQTAFAIGLLEHAMAAIEPTRIRPLWDEHYPKWWQNPASKVVCLTISRTIKEQAALLTAGSNWSVKLGVTLASYSIPKDQFAEFVENGT